MNAVDFSWQRPTAQELNAAGVGALVYDKTFGPNQSNPETYRAELAAAGVTTAGIHEEDGIEAWSGYDRGVRAAKIADGVFSPGVFVYYCAADKTHKETAGHEPAISEFFRGVGETTREPECGAYGPINGLRAAQTGSAKVTKLWGVELWHPANDQYHDGDPRTIDIWRTEGVHLLQMVSGAPIDGTDLDLALRPDWATQEDDMTQDEYDYLAKGIYLLTDGATSTAGRVASMQAELDEVKAMVAKLSPSGGGSGNFTFTGTAKST